jgi:hypothetical protein
MTTPSESGACAMTPRGSLTTTTRGRKTKGSSSCASLSMDEIACFDSGEADHHQPPPLRLPDFYLEGVGGIVNATDPLWQERNTFPMFNMDIRYLFGADGSWSFLGSLTPAQFAASLKNFVTFFFNAVAATWPAGKPHQYAAVVRGFDAPDADYTVAQDKGDAYTAGVASPWSDNSRADSAPYMLAAWAAARSALDLAALPHPTRIVSDCESRGDVWGVVDVMWPALLIDARYAVNTIDGTQTLAQWAAAHGTDETGAAIPAFNAGASPYHPVNWKYAHRCIAAVESGYRYALDQIIYQPFKAAFGPRPYGEWEQITGRKPAGTLWRPGQTTYQNDGRGLGVAIPHMYGHPMVWRGNDLALTDDPRWETLVNYEARYGSSGATVATRTHYVGRRSGVELVQTLRAGCEAEIMPSISQNQVGRTAGVLDADAVAKKAAFAPIMAGYIAEATRAGASAFWMFESDYWQTSAVDRVCVAAIVQQANARLSTGNYA